MFSPGSLEKNSSTLAESHSPGRSKFPVGLNQLVDESQQNNRIQSAVHRYNNSTVSSFARTVNERSMPSPFRHTFLKNAQKYKNFESDKEEAQNNSKKSHNSYEGIGNFPVVHLKKNSVINRPIKRSMNNEFKIQFPELPFNRFLNHSPDICLDTKTSTRSVLDVLQDLSRKRIHTKDDTEATKRKCKGLGGDSPLDIEAPYKPLFVPKTKSSAVTLRDSTTQTQDIPPVELSPSKKNDTILNNKKDDPKAELRRKLARQNNEIFASLSSSTLMYPLKRNSGKLSQDKDGTKNNELNAKRVKYFLEEKNDKKLQNGDVSSKDLLSASNGDVHSSKTEKRHKAADSKLSPNKDRLTTIFLEMQHTNPNPIADVLTNNQAISSEDAEPAKTLRSDKSVDKLMPPENKNSTNELEAANKNISSQSPVGLTSDNKQNDKITSFLSSSNNNINKDIIVAKSNSFSSGNVTTSNFGISTSTTINFGLSTTSPAFKLPLASTVSSSLTQTPIFSTGVSPKGSMLDVNSGGGAGSSNVSKVQENFKNGVGVENSEVNSPNQQLSFKPSTSESGPGLTQQSTGVGMFKFGIGAGATLSSQSAQSEKGTSQITKDAEKSCSGTSSATSVACNPTLSGLSSNISGALGSQSPFAISTGTVTAALYSLSQQTAPVMSFTDKSSNATGEAAEKPAFQFGFNATAASNPTPPSMFTIGPAASKPEDKTATEQKNENKDIQNPEFSNANTSISGFPPSTFQNVFSTSTPSFGQTAVTSAPSFGQPAVTSAPSFGQTAVTSAPSFGQPAVTSAPSLGQPAITSAPSFGQPAVTSAPSFGQPAVTSAPSFGQPAVTSTQNVMPFKFGEKTETSKKDGDNHLSGAGTNFFDPKKPSLFAFGQKPEASLSTTAGESSASQPNLFEQSKFSFGQKSTASTSAVSQTSTSSSLFGQSTAPQSNIFQQAAVSQAITAANPIMSSGSPFGVPSRGSDILNKPQVPSFVPTSTTASTGIMSSTFTQNKLSAPAFGQTSTATFSGEKNIFGASSQTAPAFGGASTGQSGSTFGDSNKQQSSTGQTSNFFAQPPTTQSSGFNSSTGFGTSTFLQAPSADSIFGQNQNQSTPFGQSSTAQPFGSQTGFSFGATTTSSTSFGFPMSTPSTTTSVFGFGSTTRTTPASTSTFGFTGSTQPEPSSQSLFSFNNQPQASNTFKFGNPAAKDTPAFGSTGSASSTFSFNSTPSTSEAAKPSPSVFNFGTPQTTSANTGFNFGGSQTPVFSFGSSGSSASSSKFSFGASPSNAGLFTPRATPSPSSVPLQGVFSIGSGSSQPRNRSSAARARRRP